MIAGHPVAHKEGHYRCSLPDLAEFMILCCTGPGYQTEIWNLTKKKAGYATRIIHFPISKKKFIPFSNRIVKKIRQKRR